MKLLSTILLLLVSMSAYAIGNSTIDNNQQQQMKQQQDQRQQQRASSDQQQRQAARARNDGNNTSINQVADYAKTYQEYVAPAYAPPLAATGDCLGSGSLGGSNSVMGLSLGKTYVDEDCNARRDSIHLHALGRHEAAIMRLCARPEMAKVLPECPQPERTVYNGWDD